jgi:hypothetical protein
MPPLRALHVVGVLGSALYSLRRAKRAEPPSHFCCSITGDLFVDPVIVVSSGARSGSLRNGVQGFDACFCAGHTYERAAIEAWFATKPTCTDPNTGCECEPVLVPNWCATRKAHDPLL